ncbi:hypothetical protein RBH29_16090 [Herbivorax sp. ANBcel31]|uniref:DUF6618 family protein n=1 Tax=Herbivorax sp. ANBcel31 TaxID=3069754 RepID=UPI0027B1A6CF|nr:DUF6618 family protein [Herbivorax sp. ANBcel31]MDQ2087950.1 hypothetical protein [Herbivorax sp. ANBcel31]
MNFECTMKKGKSVERWFGTITKIQNWGSHYEINILSRSSIMVLFGETSRGYYACMPDFKAGCHLVNFRDLFWNTEALTEVLRKVDGITVATALYTLEKHL